jgi:RNA recognition motif-containing protein
MAAELYVGNLTFETTADDLRRIFAVAGKVTSVHIITDPVSGKSKGCGYVRMATTEEAAEAIESLDGALIGERIITVSMARPQKQQGRQPGGGPGRQRSSGRIRRGPK